MDWPNTEYESHQSMFVHDLLLGVFASFDGRARCRLSVRLPASGHRVSLWISLGCLHSCGVRVRVSVPCTALDGGAVQSGVRVPVRDGRLQ